MKKTTLGKLKDGQVFALSQRSEVRYKLNRKFRTGGISKASFTSVESERTFVRTTTTVVYV